jgi:hypothetical protein
MQSITVDVFNKDNEPEGQKRFYMLDETKTLNNWLANVPFNQETLLDLVFLFLLIFNIIINLLYYQNHKQDIVR